MSASLQIKVDTQGLEQRFTQAPALINAELRRTIELSAIDFEGAVVDRTPVGATGHLRQSVTHLVSGEGLSMVGRVISNDDPAKVASVELGARPHWAPIGPLLAWARAKLGSEGAAYAVQRAIALRGTPAVGMFHRGYLDALPKVRSRAAALQAQIGRML